VLDAAVNAELVCSAALRRDEFRSLIAASRSLNLKDEASSGLDEIDRVLEIVRARRGGRPTNAGPTWAQADSLLHRRGAAEHAPECEVFALSPSSATLTRSLHDIAELLPKLGSPKRAAVNVAPNDTALVVAIRCGHAVAVLGSDLETGASNAVGWGAVLTTKALPGTASRVFKVPHHGAETAHHPGQWSTIVAPGGLAIVTPYATGRKPLPTESDLVRLKGHRPGVYCTAPPPAKAAVADHMVQRTVNEVAKIVRTRGTRMGHVRVRFEAAGLTPATVELFGAAFAA